MIKKNVLIIILMCKIMQCGYGLENKENLLQEEDNKEIKNLPFVPPELYKLIFDFLPFKDRIKLLRVSKEWAAIIYSCDTKLDIGKNLYTRPLARLNRKFSNITNLDMGENEIISKIETFIQLKVLNFGENNEVTTINSLTNLTKLNLGYNNKVTSIKSLTNLTKLNPGQNKKINPEIMFLTNLKTLDLTYNATIGNKHISNLTGLKNLSLSRNCSITDEVFTILTNIDTLNLQYNNLITNRALIPLTNLTDLDLDNNDIITVAGITHLNNLITLRIMWSAIKKPEVDRLTHLTKLKNFCDDWEDVIQ